LSSSRLREHSSRACEQRRSSRDGATRPQSGRQVSGHSDHNFNARSTQPGRRTPQQNGSAPVPKTRRLFRTPTPSHAHTHSPPPFPTWWYSRSKDHTGKHHCYSTALSSRFRTDAWVLTLLRRAVESRVTTRSDNPRPKDRHRGYCIIRIARAIFRRAPPRRATRR
jgi:hypothetical protein